MFVCEIILVIPRTQAAEFDTFVSNLIFFCILVFLFHDMSTFVGYLILKQLLLKNCNGTIYPIAGGW